MGTITASQVDFLRDLVADKNYLGAAQYLKELPLEAAERSAKMGTIITAVVDDLASHGNNRERTMYNRSVLSWLLRDYPGLATLYREQLRLTSGDTGVLPELTRGFRNMGDVLSGKKTVVEGVQDAAEPLGDIAGQAESSLQDGLNRIATFFAGFSRKDEQDDHNTESKDGVSTEDGESIVVNIENADDPLPHKLHEADK